MFLFWKMWDDTIASAAAKYAAQCADNSKAKKAMRKYGGIYSL